MACISRMDSSTFPCSPAEPHQSVITQQAIDGVSLAETSETEQKGMGRTIDLDLFSPPLNCQFDFRDLAHLEDNMTPRSVFGLHHNFQNVSGSKRVQGSDQSETDSKGGFG